ncbi:TetR/AcrR family transcriptional regulator [Allokutzneria sp. NRRL B-24872]|uniref:TetR/AcrR family transcriptional regulator n=1 Tax=Allokutzneria sp. NRRL B-24872 TaxID=1137961 RepID=UPI000A35F01A|nr:TetR/AcrR family transcriptional regulator [Allokutzneria sp. NRRL B-24872]
MSGTENTNDLPPGVRRAWGLPGRVPTRGPKASLTLDAVVEAAVALGDAEGIDSISLTQVASRLGVTTNALYRYIDSRDELHVLAREHALGPPTTGASASWQDGVEAWAVALRARYAAHPWMVDLRVRLPVTPHALAWLEALLAALEHGSFTTAETLRVAALVDSYVRACAIAARDLAALESPTPATASAVNTIAGLLAERGLDRVATAFGSGLYTEPADGTNDADFQYGLKRIVAGIEALAAP